MIPPLYSSIVVLLAKSAIAFAAITGVALDQGERGRADEQLVDALGAGLGGGELGEPVLDHLEAGVGLAQAAAQLGGLGDADPAVVDREDRLGVLEALGELGDRCFFLRLCPSLQSRSSLGRRRQERACAQAGSRSDGLSTSPAPVFRAASWCEPRRRSRAGYWTREVSGSPAACRCGFGPSAGRPGERDLRPSRAAIEGGAAAPPAARPTRPRRRPSSSSPPTSAPG